MPLTITSTGTLRVFPICSLQLPVRLLRIRQAPDLLVGLLGQQAGRLERYVDLARLGQAKLASVLAHMNVIGREVYQMASAIGHVASAIADLLAPRVEIELVVRASHTIAPGPYALAVDAGEIGFAAGAGAKAAVEGVVPHVQFPDVRRIDGGHEIIRRGLVCHRARARCA